MADPSLTVQVSGGISRRCRMACPSATTMNKKPPPTPSPPHPCPADLAWLPASAWEDFVVEWESLDRVERAAPVPVSPSLGCRALDAAPTTDEANTALRSRERAISSQREWLANGGWLGIRSRAV